MKKKLGRNVTAVLLTMAVLFASLPVTASSAGRANLQIGVISDTHYFSKEQAGDYCDAFMKEQGSMGKQFLQSEGLLDSALAALEAHAKKNGMKFVLLPGDLTKDGELAGHKNLAKRLQRFEKETGLQVAVIPGNHDINCPNVADYSTGVSKKGEMTSPEKFREIYAQLGFDLPNAAYFTPAAGKKGGMLSYAADLGKNYRLVALDTCKYSPDQTEKELNENETGGMVSKELLAWAVKQCKDAVKAGKTVIGMGHHNLVPHVGGEERIFVDFVLDDWLRVSETLADAGMHYYFSGHIHQGEIGKCISDSGDVLYDICTASLVGYPCTFREVLFSSGGKNDITADVKTYDADCVKAVEANGKTYPKPYTKTAFGLSYGTNGVAELLPNMLGGMLGGLFGSIEEGGGIGAFLKASGIDLEAILDEAIGGGLKIGSASIAGAKNIMGVLNDVFKQVDKTYVNRPDHTMKVLNEAIAKLVDMQVSPHSSTAFLKSYGLGDASKPGTFADMANEALVYTYGRVGGVENNKFFTDAMARFESGENVDKLVDLLLDVLLHDLLEGEILKSLKLNLSPVFVTPFLRYTVGLLLDGILAMLLLGDTSFTSLVNFVFKIIDTFNILPYASLDEVVEYIMEEYWTPSQSEGIGYQLVSIVGEMVTDRNDVPDTNAALQYTGKRKVPATQDNSRLPSKVVQMLPAEGDDYDRAISWYTKDSVKGTDIVVRDNKGRDVTKRLDIKKKTEAVERNYPGVDLGIIGFITVGEYLRRHTVEISGLDPLQAYTFQVGDASKGWWSQTGIMRVPLAGNQDTTFLSFTDQQGQSPHMYKRSWGKLSEAAVSMYPDALLGISLGDQVDNGENLQQWTWFFDQANTALRELPIMPAAGNHEDAGKALQSYFPFGKLAGDGEDGVYYSYDLQNVHVTVLNTNDLGEDNKLSAKQLEWLKQDLSDSTADWNIVAMHKSLYSNGSHISDSDVVAMREQLPAIFAEYGVDLVISGHDHTFMRTEVKGVPYIIAGTSGVKFYNAKDPAETAAYFEPAKALVEATGSIFCAYEAKGNTLAYTAYMMDKNGKVSEIDSMTLQKDSIELRPVKKANWGIVNSILPPATGENWITVTLPLSLMIAAGFVLHQLQSDRAKKEEIAAV